MASLLDLVGNYDRANNASMKRQLDGAKFNQGVVKQQGGDFTKFIKSANSDLEADALGIYKDIQKGARLEDMDNKPAGFETTEDFKAWYEGTGAGTGFANKKYSNLGDTDLSDYVSLYGHKGTFRKLNEMGFGTALLGPDKQFDPDNSTIRQNPETGEMEMVPYVRTNSEARKQSYSAPMTVGGKDIRETITQFGPEAAEEAIVGLSMGDLNTVFQEYARDVEIGGGGNPAMSNLAPMTDIPWGSPDRKAIEDAIETRVAGKEDTSTAGGEDAAITQGNTAVDPAAAVDPVATPTATPATPQGSVISLDQLNIIGKESDRMIFNTLANPQSTKLRNETALGKDFYQSNSAILGAFTEEEVEANTSYDQRSRAKIAAKRISNDNVTTKVQDQINSYYGSKNMENQRVRGAQSGGPVYSPFGGDKKNLPLQRNSSTAGRIARLKGTAGVDNADVETMENNAKWYKDNKQDLIAKLNGNAGLYNEFIQDPDAFVARYAGDETFFGSSISAPDRAVIVSNAKDNNIGGGEKDIIGAIANVDPNAIVEGFNKSIQNSKPLNETQQENIVNTITKNGFNFAQLDKARRVTLASELWAGLSDEQRTATNVGPLVNLIETGDLSLTSYQQGSLQNTSSSTALSAAKFAQEIFMDEAKLSEPAAISKKVTEMFDRYFDADDPLILTEKNISVVAQSVGNLLSQAKAMEDTRPQELDAAITLGMATLDKYVAIKGAPKWWQEFITLGYAEGPRAGGFNFGPDVRGFDKAGNITTNPESIVSFAAIKSKPITRQGDKGFEIVGNEINTKTIIADMDLPGLDVLYEAMMESIARNGR